MELNLRSPIGSRVVIKYLLSDWRSDRFNPSGPTDSAAISLQNICQWLISIGYLSAIIVDASDTTTINLSDADYILLCLKYA